MLTYFGEGRDAAAIAAAQGTLQAVRGYWEGLRRQGGIPARADIDPRGMAQCLERVFLVERIAPGQARFRLAGMHLADVMGMDVRGMPLSSLFEPSARARLGEALEQAFSDPAIVEVGLEAERGVGRKALTGRMLLLPLRGDLDEAELALGCLATIGNIGRAPRRFAISSLQPEPVMAQMPRLRAVEPTRPTIAPARTQHTRPWLRLVSSIEL